MDVRIWTLKELVDAIGAAGDAVIKITDGIKHLVKTGVDAYDGIQVRRTYNALLGQSVRFAVLIREQRALAGTMKGYVSVAPQLEAAARQVRWSALSESLVPTMASLHEALRSLEDADNEFVLGHAYMKLNNLFMQPLTMIREIGNLPAPTTPGELELITRMSDRYARLVAEVERARTEMNTYIKSLKAPKA